MDFELGSGMGISQCPLKRQCLAKWPGPSPSLSLSLPLEKNWDWDWGQAGWVLGGGISGHLGGSGTGPGEGMTWARGADEEEGGETASSEECLQGELHRSWWRKREGG